MRECKSEIDFSDDNVAIWVVHFHERYSRKFSIGYRDMSTANEAKRRWLIGIANEVNDLAEVDRFREDAIVYG